MRHIVIGIITIGIFTLGCKRTQVTSSVAETPSQARANLDRAVSAAVVTRAAAIFTKANPGATPPSYEELDAYGLQLQGFANRGPNSGGVYSLPGPSIDLSGRLAENRLTGNAFTDEELRQRSTAFVSAINSVVKDPKLASDAFRDEVKQAYKVRNPETPEAPSLMAEFTQQIGWLQNGMNLYWQAYFPEGEPDGSRFQRDAAYRGKDSDSGSAAAASDGDSSPNQPVTQDEPDTDPEEG